VALEGLTLEEWSGKEIGAVRVSIVGRAGADSSPQLCSRPDPRQMRGCGTAAGERGTRSA
jgi:hypothetical protein